MKITDLQVTSFGHWNGLELRDLSDGVNVIYGPNEAGKSTLLQFIRAVLYGFSPERHKRFVPPVYDGKVGGEVAVQSSMGRYRIHRHLPEPGRLADHDRAELVIQATNGTKAGRHLLGNILSGVDEAIFHNVFAVGLTEMQQLGTLSDTAASQQLYGLAMGTDRVSLMEVTQSLEQDRLQLIASDDRDCHVVQLLRQKERLIREIQATQQDNQRWGSLMKEHKDIDKEISELEAQKVQFAQEGDIREIVAQLRSKWNSCQEIHDQLQAFGTVAPISSEWMKRIRQTNQEIKDKRNQWSKIKQQRAELKSQADALPAPSDTSRFAAEIELLARRKGQFKTLRHDIERLSKQSEEAEFEIQAEMERLGVKSSYSYDRMPVITDDMVVSLRGRARECKDAKELIEECERNAKQFQDEAEKHQRNMQIATSRFGDQDLTKILLSLQTQTDHLEAKLNLENQQAKLKRTEKSLREELFTWQERMVLPWRVLMFLGVIFAAGVVVSLIGLTGNYLSLSDDKRWMMGIIGMAISAFAIIMKNVSQFGAARGADACEDELESLNKKWSLLNRDAEELDKHIPDESEPLTTRLEAKEAAIDELQEFLPLENQRKQALERAEDALRQKEFATRQLQDARQHWRNSLVSLSLPESLTPSQFAKLTEQTGKMGHLRERILRARHDLDQKQQELRLAEQRIDSLMAGLSLIPDSEDLDAQVIQLEKAVRKFASDAEKREGLFRKWRELGREQERLARVGEQLQERRRQFLQRCNAVDDVELRSMWKRQSESQQLSRQRDQLAEQIAGIMGGSYSPKHVLRQLDEGGFERKLAKLESTHQDVTGRLAQLYERRGEVSQAIKSLSANRDSAVKRLELAEVEQRLEEGLDRWRTLAVTSRVLDLIRQNYESDRQPETLAEASDYLRRLTRNRYNRIWTPFGESALCVDDEHGKSLPIEVLSRGTREQLFLSLRLALASGYSRRGSRLPLILDDVFVNFDRERAIAAVETIRDFAAAGNQVLVFTCHEHIEAAFREFGVDVRELPKAADVARGIETSPKRRYRDSEPLHPVPPPPEPPPVFEPPLPEPAVPLAQLAEPEPVPRPRVFEPETPAASTATTHVYVQPAREPERSPTYVTPPPVVAPPEPVRSVDEDEDDFLVPPRRLPPDASSTSDYYVDPRTGHATSNRTNGNGNGRSNGTTRDSRYQYDTQHYASARRPRPPYDEEFVEVDDDIDYDR